MSSIPAGYQLQLTTWENDGDNYKRQTFSGLSTHDVMFYLVIADRFHRTNPNRLGNQEVPGVTQIEVFNTALSQHPQISQDIRKSFTLTDEDLAYEKLCEILGSPGEDYGSNFCRVFESYKVFFFREDVHEVTTTFKNQHGNGRS